MNQFGRIFRIQIFGESHGPRVGLVMDGLPPGLPLSDQDFILDINRRRPGALGTTTRIESDIPIIESGLFNGYTTGAPMMMYFLNNDHHSSDYTSYQNTPRPGHADFVAAKKFKGFQDFRGGGHFSGRLTLPLVAAGVVAKKLIHPIEVKAELIEVGGQTDIQKAIHEATLYGDSVGGLIKCTALKVPVGLGEPFFDSVESLISHIIFSIPAIKGISFGSGFDSAKMRGSEHNDSILDIEGHTATNHAGGINGGISNGNDIVFHIAVKPTSSIRTSQNTVDMVSGDINELFIQGRHDACIALRVPVVAEAVTAIVLADLLMLFQRMGQ